MNGFLLVLATAVISGFSIFLNKFGVAGVNASAFTFLKNALVALILATIILGFKGRGELKVLSRKAWAKLAVIGIIGGSIPFLLFFNGLQITTAPKAAFIHKTMFVFVAVLAFFFLKERLGKKQVLATLGLLAGSFFLIGAPTTIDQGVLMVLAATLFWSVENVLSKRLLAEIAPDALAFGRMFFGSIILAAFLLATGGLAGIEKMAVANWEWVLISTIPLTAYLLTWYRGLSKIRASDATAILALGSVVTALLDYTIKPAATPEQILGILLMLASAAVLLGAAWASGKRIGQHAFKAREKTVSGARV